MFDVAACLDAANRSRLDDWIDRYLGGGPWANPGLREGLKLQRRYWIGPLRLPLAQLARCCGPEPEMQWPVGIENWHAKVSRIAAGLIDPMAVPPLIVEWRAGALMICDGSHRSAAMLQAGWTQCLGHRLVQQPRRLRRRARGVGRAEFPRDRRDQILAIAP